MLHLASAKQAYPTRDNHITSEQSIKHIANNGVSHGKQTST